MGGRGIQDHIILGLGLVSQGPFGVVVCKFGGSVSK